MTDSPSKDPHKIRRMFGAIAGRYDLLNRILSLNVDSYWRRRLVESIRGERLLDVACGTGDVLRAAAANDRMTLRAGIDFAHPMLLNARTKVSPGVRLIQGDALRLPIRTDSFDTVTCAFGVRNFADRTRAFTEFARVLRPGGRLLILEFFPPKNSWLSAPYRLYLTRILPRIGQWISGSDGAYDYLKRSVEAFVSRDRLRRELDSSGFENVEYRELTGGIATLIRTDNGS